MLDGRIVDLGAIRCPVLNVYARNDHLVPASASRPLADHVASSDYSELEFEGANLDLCQPQRTTESAPGDCRLAEGEVLIRSQLRLAGDFESQRPDVHVGEDTVGALHRCHGRIGAYPHAEKIALTLH